MKIALASITMGIPLVFISVFCIIIIRLCFEMSVFISLLHYITPCFRQSQETSEITGALMCRPVIFTDKTTVLIFLIIRLLSLFRRRKLAGGIFLDILPAVLRLNYCRSLLVVIDQQHQFIALKLEATGMSGRENSPALHRHS